MEDDGISKRIALVWVILERNSLMNREEYSPKGLGFS